MAPEIIVINLDCDTARLAHMRRQLSGVGLRYERFAALRGDALLADLARYFPAGARLSSGEIGCYASHLAIMQRIVRGEIAQPLLVLEDDVGPCGHRGRTEHVDHGFAGEVGYCPFVVHDQAVGSSPRRNRRWPHSGPIFARADNHRRLSY